MRKYKSFLVTILTAFGLIFTIGVTILYDVPSDIIHPIAVTCLIIFGIMLVLSNFIILLTLGDNFNKNIDELNEAKEKYLKQRARSKKIYDAVESLALRKIGFTDEDILQEYKDYIKDKEDADV